MGDIVNWIPSAVAVGAIGSLYFIIRKMINDSKTETKDKLMEQDEKIEKVEEELGKYMEIDRHATLCELNTLKVITKFNEELTAWKDETFKFFRNFESKFENKLVIFFDCPREKSIFGIQFCALLPTWAGKYLGGDRGVIVELY